MTVVTDPRRARSRREAAAPPRTRRTLELGVIAAAIVLSVVALGGFSLVMNRIDAATFGDVVLPALFGSDTGIARDEAYAAGQTLGAWFGATLVVVLLLSAAGIHVARRRPWRRSAGWWFLSAGLVCLLGSQLILYPIAFIFFVGAGLFALRPITEGSPS